MNDHIKTRVRFNNYFLLIFCSKIIVVVFNLSVFSLKFFVQNNIIPLKKYNKPWINLWTCGLTHPNLQPYPWTGSRAKCSWKYGYDLWQLILVANIFMSEPSGVQIVMTCQWVWSAEPRGGNLYWCGPG